jgi:hypothetical protein
VTIARLLVYRRILLSLLLLVEEDLCARGWRGAAGDARALPDRRVS